MRISDWSSDVCSSDLRSHRRGGALRKCAVRLTRRLPAPFQPEGSGAGSDLQKGLSYSPAGPLRPPRFFLSSAMMCWIAHDQQRPEFSVEIQSVAVETCSRSEASRVGTESVSTCRISEWPLY